MKLTKTITVRMPEELHERIKEAATIQKVSMNEFCVDVLKKASDATIPTGSLERYVGTFVIVKCAIPSDKRGQWIRPGERLLVEAVYGNHFTLVWPDTKRVAATQVYLKNLKTGIG
jgi:hypothetical protein